MKALLIVDVQNDFCPGGSYPVPKGDEVVKPLNQILAYARKNNWLVVASKDWHTKELFVGKESKTHCIQNSYGAKYHPNLHIKEDVLVITKGSRDLSDKHYSAFKGDKISLNDVLKQNNVETVYVGGLATEYCVKSSVLDSVNLGYKTFLLKDACRAINKNSGDEEATFAEIRKTGVEIIKTEDILK